MSSATTATSRLTGARASRIASVLRSPRAVALTVLSVYALWLCAYFASGRTVWGFALVGQKALSMSHKSTVLTTRAGVQPTSDDGFDGQYYFFVAADPANARYYISDDFAHNPNYVYGRIVYPMTARALALGQAQLVPYTLVIVNLLAAVAGTLLLASWLKRKGLSPWIALLYGFYPGIFIALIRDCVEPLGYAFVILGWYALEYRKRGRIPVSALCFAVAALTRETLVVFPAVIGLWLCLRDWKSGRRLSVDGLRFWLLSLLPIALYTLFLWHWLGTPPKWPSGGKLQVIPFHGLFQSWPAFAFERVESGLTIAFSGVMALVLGILGLARGAWDRVELWLLLVNVELFTIALNITHFSNIFGAPRH